MYKDNLYKAQQGKAGEYRNDGYKLEKLPRNHASISIAEVAILSLVIAGIIYFAYIVII